MKMILIRSSFLYICLRAARLRKGFSFFVFIDKTILWSFVAIIDGLVGYKTFTFCTLHTLIHVFPLIMVSRVVF